MKKLKGVKIIIGSVLLIPTAAFVCFALVWLLIFGFQWLSPNPPQPQITTGEFPFELTYTFEGKTVTVTDVYVCQYEGIDVNEGVGKYREWRGYIKSTGEEHLEVSTKENEKIVCYVGSAAYYMNDPQYFEIYDVQEITPDFTAIRTYDSVTSHRSLSQEELNSYGIEIKLWKCSSPIQNVYE